jgi:flagellar hook-associated protein 3 FlgL
MRVTQSLQQTNFISSLDAMEANISQTENEISSGDSYTEPSQNPTAAGEVDNYNQVLAQSQQYSTNANAAQTSLNTEDSTLTQVTNQLQSLRDLALEANSGTESGQNLSALATQVQQIQNTLLSLANTQSGNGTYIFAGYASQTEPFALTSAGATYSGDQGQPQAQISAGQTVATADNGDTVFNNIKTGNGTFTVSASAANTGSALIGAATVTNPSAYTAGSYAINFTTASTYQVVNSTTAAVLTTGTYTSGQAISFNGVQVTLSGTPAANDSFAVAPSTNQSIFATVQNLVNTLTAGGSGPTADTQLSNTLSGVVSNIDQALNQVSTVQASVGGRLNSITTQLSVGTSQQTQLTESISNLQGLDYASAYTSLESQNTTLSAAMQAFTLTQGLSLFKYISG